MAFIIYRCGDRFLLQSAETGGYMGLIIQGFPEESARAFAYDFGQVFYPKEIVNFHEFPELAQMPFFSVDYSVFNHDLMPKLDPKKDATVLNILKSECKVNAYHNNQYKQGQSKLTLLWQYTPPNTKGLWKLPIWSLTVNNENCWLGNRDGLMLGLNQEGAIINQQELASKINCFLTNENYFYCACDDGQIYDLRGKIPQSVFNLHPHTYYSNLNIFNLAFAEDNILIVDTHGNLKLVNHQFKIIWENNRDQLWRSWFLAYQDPQIYVGHSKGINCYDIGRGKLLWKNEMKSSVLWGEIVNKSLIIGTSNGQIYKVNQQGDWKTQKTRMRKIFQGQSALFSGIIMPEKKLIITADYQGYIYCLNCQGKLMFQSQIEKGAILNLKPWQNLIFAVTTEGTILAFDLQEIVL